MDNNQRKTRIEKSLNKMISIALRCGESAEVEAALAFKQAVERAGRDMRKPAKAVMAGGPQ